MDLVVRVIGSLVLIVGLIYGVAFLLRFYYGRIPGQGPGAGNAMRLAQVIPLGPGKALLLVFLGEWAFLIGSSGSGLTLLAQLKKKELVDNTQDRDAADEKDAGD